jgi:hypothetical protein
LGLPVAALANEPRVYGDVANRSDIAIEDAMSFRERASAQGTFALLLASLQRLQLASVSRLTSLVVAQFLEYLAAKREQQVRVASA